MVSTPHSARIVDAWVPISSEQSVIIVPIEPAVHFSLDSSGEHERLLVAGPRGSLPSGVRKPASGRRRIRTEETKGSRRDRRSRALPGGPEIGV